MYGQDAQSVVPTPCLCKKRLLSPSKTDIITLLAIYYGSHRTRAINYETENNSIEFCGL